MADGTLRGAFELSADQPIRQLHGVRDAGASADTSLRSLGGTMERLVSPVATERLDAYKGKIESVATTAETTSERTGRAWENTTRKISDQITIIEGRVDELDAKLDRFGGKSVDATVGLDGIAEANVQLTELERRLDRLDRRNATARVGLSGGGLFSDVAGRGGGGGGGVTSTAASSAGPSSLFQAVGGLPTLALAALGLSPGIMGLLGGATALVGSAGAAGLGAGAVGLGAAGVLGVGGLGAFAGVKSSITDLKNLTQAQSAYNKAVQQYGQASTQAATAQQKLRMEEVANAQALPMFRQLTALKSDFTTATAPARSAFYTAGTDVLYNLRRGIPSVGRDVTTSTAALGGAASTYSRFLTSTPTLSGVTQLTNAFASDLPLIERTFQNLTSTAEHLAVAAIPFFHEANVWVANWTGGLARSTADTPKVQMEMDKLVTSAKDWGSLLGAAGTLLKDIASAGAPSGNSMVVSLTKTLDSWDKWINDNPQKVDAFFTKAEHTTSSIAQGVAQIAGDFAKLGQLLGPIFDRAMGLAHILLSLGPGGMALLGGGVYGGLRGLRSAGYRVPSAGALAGSAVTGSGLGVIRSAQGVRGGGGGGMLPVPLAAGRSAAAFERVTPLGPVGSAGAAGDAFAMPAASESGAMYWNKYGGLVEPTSAAPVLAAEREARTVTGTLRSAVGTARGALASLGEGVKTFGAGAVRVAGPLLAFQAVMSGLSTQPGVPGQDSGGGLHGFAARMLHGFGIGSGYTSPTTAGNVASQHYIASLPPGVDPFGPLALGILQLQGRVGGITSGGRPLVQPQAGQIAEINRLVEAQTTGLAAQAGSVTTAAGARRIASRVGQVQLELPSLSVWGSKEAEHLSAEFKQITSTAFTAAGQAAGGRWTTALDAAIGRGEKPTKAISTLLSGMTKQIQDLGPKGSIAMARSMGQWAQSMEEQNPKLIRPMEHLMQGITDRMNKVNHTTGTTWQDIQNKIFWFNGQIFKGSQTTWQHIGNALTNPAQVAQERLLGIFGQIQKEAVNALQGMGFSHSQAQHIVTSLAGGGVNAQIASSGVQAVSQGTPASAAASAITLTQSRYPHERGGVFGGTGLLDTVPLPDGSRAAPGEGWIANGPTMDDLSRATIPMYGKTAWQMIQGETIPHSSWGRVFRPGQRRNATLGMAAGGGGGGGTVVQDPGVNMTVGQEPQILQDLYALSRELHNSIYVISGYRSPAHSVAVGGFADDPHTKGEAADIGVGGASRDSMFGVAEQQLRNVGLYRPFYPASAAEVNHVQLASGSAGGLVPHGGGARLGLRQIHLKAPRGGMAGVPGVLLDRGSQIYAAGLQRHVNSQIGSMGGGSTAGLSGNLTAMVGQLAHRFGWGQSEIDAWLQVINRESGGSMTATNPGSGAYGIAQFINGPSEYATYGGNSTTMAGQLLAMGNYIRGRYGDPAGAWSHEQSAGWYGRGGGPVKWGGWNKYGVDMVVDGPTLFGAGERGRERVRVSPTSQAVGGGHQINVNFYGTHLSAQPRDIKRIGRQVAEEILDHLDGADDQDLIGVNA